MQGSGASCLGHRAGSGFVEPTTENQESVLELWAAQHQTWSFCVFATRRCSEGLLLCEDLSDSLWPPFLLLLPAPLAPHLPWGVAPSRLPCVHPHLSLFDDNIASGLTGKQELISRANVSAPPCGVGRGRVALDTSSPDPSGLTGVDTPSDFPSLSLLIGEMGACHAHTKAAVNIT